MASHAVTGALGFSGRHIAGRLLARGDGVVNLTNHPDRPDPFGAAVPAAPLDFGHPDALARALEGVDTLVNTYWVRFPRQGRSHADAVRNSRTLFEAAHAAGVRRIVHVSIANPDPASHLSYYRGKAQVEAALATSGVSHAILRPTVLFGDEPILANSIAWLLRRSPVFGIPGDGRYGIQPIAVEDLARLVLEAIDRTDDFTADAAGPEVLSFTELVEAIRAATGSRARLVHLPGPVALAAAAVLGRAVGDVLLTREELEGLSSGLLVSRELPRGTTRFTDWLAANGTWLGRRYLSEVGRHFVAVPA
jgi:uncharacterized protein YbjT (DUF2867 family)